MPHQVAAVAVTDARGQTGCEHSSVAAAVAATDAELQFVPAAAVAFVAVLELSPAAVLAAAVAIVAVPGLSLAAVADAAVASTVAGPEPSLDLAAAAASAAAAAASAAAAAGSTLSEPDAWPVGHQTRASALPALHKSPDAHSGTQLGLCESQGVLSEARIGVCGKCLGLRTLAGW